MHLSSLQKHILKQGLNSRGHKVSKKILSQFYLSRENSPKLVDQINIITKSVERLIKNGLAKGLGAKTAEKWLIKEVILTKLGIKKAKELLGKQQELPLKKIKQ